MAKKIFRRELFTSFSICYFPLMILMCIIVLKVDVLERNIAIAFPLLCLLFPAIVSVVMAFVRVRIVWGIEYKPNWRNQSLFLAIISFMFLLEKLLYTILQQPDFTGIAFFSILLLVALLWYKISKQRVEYKTVAQMLVLVSTLFILVWSVFTIVFKTVYSAIVLMSWILLFLISLRIALKKEEVNE